MPEARKCPTCGAELPSNRSGCIHCMMALGLEHGPQNAEAGPHEPDAAATVQAPAESSGHEPAQSETTSTIIENPEDRIGLYNVLQKIGEGGMGEVWMAEQREPIRRRVALKLIKSDLGSAQILARFGAERQALALMDHPNIAKVFDAGTAPDGRPYFVMELIKGIPITKFCDEQCLSIRERLELFMPVCQAIQHAHQKGIIHRDIKPSNVLVALYDGKPVPKVIDFGIAKATGQQLTAETLFTSFGAVVGTLQYMSPEQAELNQLDIDTRSDIYSLGVLLYELLTGTTPLTAEALQKGAFDEILRRVREEEPPRPSTRLGESKERLSSISAQRSLDPAHLTKVLRGDLDWIVMKALDKDRNRRYETANGLAMDIQRHLDDEPVLAGSPTARYRFKKFIRKHRAVVAVAAGFVLFLTLAAAVSTGLALWANRERERAKKSENEARMVLEFFREKILAAAGPEGRDGGLGRDVTLRAAVATAESAIGAAFSTQPTVEASIRDSIGLTYYYLGDYTNAIHEQEWALGLRKFHLGLDSDDTRSSMLNLARTYGADRFPEALALSEDLLRLAKTNLSCINNLAAAYINADRHADALGLLEPAWKRIEAPSAEKCSVTLKAAMMRNLAMAYDAVGRSSEANAFIEAALKLMKDQLGAEHPEMLSTMMWSGLMDYVAVGRQTEGMSLLEEVSKLMKAKLGPEHPDTLASMIAVASAYLIDGRQIEAVDLLEETLRLTKLTLPADHNSVAWCKAKLANAYMVDERFAEAEVLCQEALAAQRKNFAADSAQVGSMLAMTAVCLEASGKYDQAQPLLREALEILEKKKPGHYTVFGVRAALGEMLLKQGKYAEAEPLLLQGYHGLKEREHRIPAPYVLKAFGNDLVELYEAWGKPDLAAEWRRKLEPLDNSARAKQK